MIEQWTKELVVQRLLAFILLTILIILCLQVVKFFISPAIWAAILAYVTFPLYRFFHQKVRLSPTISALIMTAVISLIIGIPLVVGVFFLQQEVISFYSIAVRRLQAGYVDLPESIKDLPVIGEQIKNILWEMNHSSLPLDAQCYAAKVELRQRVRVDRLLLVRSPSNSRSYDPTYKFAKAAQVHRL